MDDELGGRAVAVGGMAGPGDAFRVVIPPVPGCGFSGPARRPGWGTGRVVQAWAAQALRQRRADVRPRVALSDWPRILLPVAVTGGARWSWRG